MVWEQFKTLRKEENAGYQNFSFSQNVFQMPMLQDHLKVGIVWERAKCDHGWFVNIPRSNPFLHTRRFFIVRVIKSGHDREIADNKDNFSNPLPDNANFWLFKFRRK